MKKLLSLVLALVTLLSVATVMTGAATTDVAETSATYYVSNKPYENVANANIIGYIGDVYVDNSISIMDATQVQLALASIIALDSTAKLLADADRDGDLSIMDATDIQCFVAQINTGSKVAHTLYTKNSAPATGDIFDQVVTFIKANSNYEAEYKWYMYTIDSYGRTISMIYYPEDNTIALSYSNVFFTIYGDDGTSTFLSSIYDNNYNELYYAWGYVSQPNANEDTLVFDCKTFESDVHSSFSQVETSIKTNSDYMLYWLNKALNGHITGSIYALFA